VEALVDGEEISNAAAEIAMKVFIETMCTKIGTQSHKKRKHSVSESKNNH
jgi:hypothetical protein